MSGQIPVKPTVETLSQSAKAIPETRGLPPVHLWNPPFCGDLDIRIARNGDWFHEGSQIRRPALVRLFSTILKKEGDRFFLVTPVEKVGITVEDAPFVAVDLDLAGEDNAQTLTFTTNVDDTVVAGPDNPIRVDLSQPDAPAPYVMVRNGLEALIDRKSFYRLIDLGEHQEIDETSWFGVRSGGVFFPILPSKDLD